MKGVAYCFFLVGVVSVTVGMVWGLQMSISQDHTLGPAHAHLNLAGWVTLALFGVYYHLTPRAAAGRLARVHLAVALLAVTTFAPGIALAILGHGEALVVIGIFATLGFMVIFLVTVLRYGLGQADHAVTDVKPRGRLAA